MQPAVLHVTILSMTGTSAGMLTVEIPLADPPAQDDTWVEQPVASLGESPVRVGQDHQGMIQFRIEPPCHPPIRLWARKIPPRQDPSPPTPE
jgi:hypothetical protein